MTDKLTDELTMYERVGGDAFFERLVDAFYAGVQYDEVLAPLYPDAPDFGPAARRLSLFLIQYWGGPMTYMEERGHPRLRMRHFPFPVGPLERDHWLAHMAAAVETVCADPAIPDGIDHELMAYFVPAAEHLRNDTGLPITTAGFRSGIQPTPPPGDTDGAPAPARPSNPPGTSDPSMSDEG